MDEQKLWWTVFSIIRRLQVIKSAMSTQDLTVHRICGLYNYIIYVVYENNA